MCRLGCAKELGLDRNGFFADYFAGIFVVAETEEHRVAQAAVLISADDELLFERNFELDPGAAAPAGLIGRINALSDQPFNPITFGLGE